MTIREMVENLTFIYKYISLSEGAIKEDALWQISAGAHAMVENAPAMMGGSLVDKDKVNMTTCQMNLKHIDEMIVRFNTTEII